MKRAVVLGLLLLVSPAYAWQPPSGGPSKMAKHVLDTLPDPTKVAIPKSIEEESRSGETTIPTQIAFKPAPPSEMPSGCWEVQLTAISDADRARELASQESSRLKFPIRVAMENGMSKLRAGGDCLNYIDATKLRDTLRDSGYPGAFVIRQSGGSGS